MSTQKQIENSAVLAKLCGWKLAANFATAAWWDENGDMVYRIEVMPGVHKPLDLYDPANMALAWRVHIEAIEGLTLGIYIGDWYSAWWRVNEMWCKVTKPGDFLDKILELAKEAGLVK